MTTAREVTMGDLVKNTNGNDISGYVIAKYKIGEITYIDVRTETKIYYKTPITNWATIVMAEDME